ncbi:MAG TPA: efflux RND transporter periplasmic adaptor subunit [Bacteroidales bacterium]|jgi:RND family efflux transporter MFP subunit|nr:efflux RND transporter periplasmic adaptor subunit [Bacteroidales bacterium]
MKSLKLIPVIFAGAFLLSGCGSKTDSASAPAQDSASVAGRAAIPVKTEAIAKTKISRTVDYTATILPFEEVNMVPSTPGRIDKMYVEIGDRVGKGQDLFLMDRTQLLQLKLQMSSLEKDLTRLDTLLKTGSAKQQQYDQLKTQYDVTKTNVDFMEQNTLIKSPFTGIVTGKYFEDGEMYSGIPTTQTGRSSIVTVMQISPLKVNVSISEQYYPLIKKGMRAQILADVYPGETFTGTVFRIAPTVNAVTRSFDVELEVPNRNDLLKPGMFVRVSMDLGEVQAFVVPANTVLVQEGTNTRYLFIDRGNSAERIDVSLGKRFDDKLEIISENLKEGDMLVTEGQSRLINGDKLEVIK